MERIKDQNPNINNSSPQTSRVFHKRVPSLRPKTNEGPTNKKIFISKSFAKPESSLMDIFHRQRKGRASADFKFDKFTATRGSVNL